MLGPTDNSGLVLANGNIMKGPKEEELILDSPELKKRIQRNQEETMREKQFGDMIVHVIEQIEKESREEDTYNEQDLWPAISPLDMKRFLKGDVNVSGVTGSSPIFILDSVNSKVGQTLHDFNIFEISQLASCTKLELRHMIKQSNVPAHEVEFALQDAKSVMDILAIEKPKAKEQTTWNSWGNLTQVGDLLQIKENSKKFANMMGHLSPKSITTSIVGAFSRNQQPGEDIDSFEEM